MKILNVPRLIFGLFVIGLVVVTELVCGYLRIPGWPAYVVWVLFFIEQMDRRKIGPILCGAATGVGLILLAPFAIGGFAHFVGPDIGRLLYVLLAVYTIFAFGEVIPWILNNYTFMVVTVAAVALGAADPNPALWLIICVVGGALLIAATLAVVTVMGTGAHGAAERV
jgi:hypothetical protein